MWMIKSEKTEECYHLLVGREYTVGRKDCDLIISNDMSISRKHAIFRVQHSELNICDKDKKSTLILKDISKLGTQLPKERISNGEERTLNDSDNITFGTANTNCFTIKYNPIIVTTSCLPKAQKKALKKLIFKLGGHLLNDWSPFCTFIVMLNLSITIKVACALLSQKYVTTLNYFEDCVKTIENGIYNKLPSPEDYLPSMAESQVSHADVTFSPLISRTSLFLNKKFVFLLRDQMERLLQVIKLGGGETYLVDVSCDSFVLKEEEKYIFLNEANCVILPDSNENSHQYENNIQCVIKYLNKSKLRMIPESEIGFAVLYCNTDTYCNSRRQRNECTQNTAKLSSTNESTVNQSTNHTHEQYNVPSNNFKRTISKVPEPNKDMNLTGVVVKEEGPEETDVNEVPHASNITPLIIEDVHGTREYDKKKINCDTYQQSEDLFNNYTVQTPNPQIRNLSHIDENLVVCKKARLFNNSSLPLTLSATNTLNVSSNISNVEMQNKNTNHVQIMLNDSKKHDTLLGTHNIHHQNVPSGIIPNCGDVTSNNTSQSHTSNDKIKQRNDTKNNFRIEGYLSTSFIDVKLKDLEFQEEINVEGGMLIEEMDLLHNKHSINMENRLTSLGNNKNEADRNGFYLWKGKWVINYKRFFKSGTDTCGGIRNHSLNLPVIIGGHDLEPHVNNDIDTDERLAKAFKQFES